MRRRNNRTRRQRGGSRTPNNLALNYPHPVPPHADRLNAVPPDEVSATLLAASHPLLPPRGTIDWVENNGCINSPQHADILLQPGQWFDRLGPTGLLSDYVCPLKEDGSTYSFEERHLPNFGAHAIPMTKTTDAGAPMSFDYRLQEYRDLYTKSNDPRGTLYWKLQINQPIHGQLCTIADAYGFATPPGAPRAIQIKLSKPILTLAANESLTIYPDPDHFPEASKN